MSKPRIVVHHRVNVQLSKVEVRFENLHIEADVAIGSQGMPTVANAFINTGKVRHMPTTSSNQTGLNGLNAFVTW